ncbi:1,4-dihydroxy-2-naphthoate polyprenyltransferase [Carnobacterium gallinarum]|uniref:prenyltransferase n=1 Tax=Carnobacterium gallinarum TaxID=2749 RepID=UPI00055155A3|nr:prenyltransferase [Carnobacterium gallinarum]
MKFKTFLELVEMQAKTASVLPYFMGILYAWYHYKELHLFNLVIFFIAMFLFNMAVDAIDNYMDYKKASNEHSYREDVNVIGREKIPMPLVGVLIVGMVVVSAGLGLYLVQQTGWPLLFMGLYCYFVGIFYSSGPKPISSMPLGELFSGFTMGFMIYIISIYVNAYNVMDFNSQTFLIILFASIPNMFAIANLMLANNICDLEEDITNKRYTLPYYLGKARALSLFKWLYILAFLVLIISVVTGIYPKMMLLTLLMVPLVKKNTSRFLEKQVKSETFIYAVQNLAAITLVQVLAFGVGIWFQF